MSDGRRKSEGRAGEEARKKADRMRVKREQVDVE